MSVAEILIEAKRLIETVGYTKQSPYAINGMGRPTDPLDEYATHFGILGAIKRAAGLSMVGWHPILVDVSKCLETSCPSQDSWHTWSRDQFVSLEEVLALLDRATEYSEAIYGK